MTKQKYDKIYREIHREERREYDRKYRKDHYEALRAYDLKRRDKQRIYSRQYYNEHKKEILKKRLHSPKQREWHLRTKYNLSVDQYNTMLVQQNGLCAICKQRPPNRVDHDHQTKTVRGLLCGLCNSGLGFFSDDPIILSQALQYLLSTHDELN